MQISHERPEQADRAGGEVRLGRGLKWRYPRKSGMTRSFGVEWVSTRKSLCKVTLSSHVWFPGDSSWWSWWGEQEPAACHACRVPASKSCRFQLESQGWLINLSAITLQMPVSALGRRNNMCQTWQPFLKSHAHTKKSSLKVVRLFYTFSKQCFYGSGFQS